MRGFRELLEMLLCRFPFLSKRSKYKEATDASCSLQACMVWLAKGILFISLPFEVERKYITVRVSLFFPLRVAVYG